MSLPILFFFSSRSRHTRFTSDWSSDVCSSDLLDLALWDIKGQALNRPLFEILGGSRKNIPAYAGGIALGWQEPAALAEEAMAHLASGYKAIKLRVGDNIRADSERVEKVRECVGDDVDILVDANTGYS